MIRDTLRKGQLDCLNKAISLDGRMPVFSAKRTGKTRAALAYAEEAKCQRVLVVLLDSFANVWELELEKLASQGSSFPLKWYRLSNGSIKERALALDAIRLSGESAIVAVNYQAWCDEPLRTAIKRWQPDLILYDEASNIIHNNKSSRFATQISTKEPWFDKAMPLTATGQERGWEDLFNIFKAANPNVFGSQKATFRGRYCVMATHRCKGCKQLVNTTEIIERTFKPCEGDYHTGWFVPIDWPQVLHYQREDEFLRKVRDNSFYVSQESEGILEPEATIVPIEFTPEARKQYDMFMKNLAHNFEAYSGEWSMDVAVDRALTTLVKAQELTGGWIKNTDGRIIDISREKLNVAVEMARNENSQGYQHAIYCCFRHDIERLAEELKIPLELTYSGLAGEGAKGQRNREEALKQLRNGNLGTLLCNVKQVRYGLNLSCCRAAGFYSFGFSYTDWDQLDGRLQDVGKIPEHFYYEVKNTVDVTKFAALRRKMNIAKAVFDPNFLRELFGDELAELFLAA